MSFRLTWLGSALAILLTANLLTGCHREKQIPTDLAKVTISKPAVHDVQNWDEYTGLVKAKEEVEIKAMVSGFLQKVEFTEGTEVTEGKVLFEIDPSTYDAALKQAKGQLQLAIAERENATKDLERCKELDKKNAISKKELEDAIAKKAKADGSQEIAQGELERATVNLKYCTIKAPISGKIGKALVTKGNLIKEAGVVLTTLVQIDPIYVEFNVDERAILEYQKAKNKDSKSPKVLKVADLKIEAQLGLSVDEGYPFKGIIDFVDNKVDPGTGTLLVRAKFGNPDWQLTPGLFARVRVATSDKHPALLVKDRALLTDQNQKYLLVAVPEADGKYKVKRKDVEAGVLLKGGWRVIKDGITAEDWVIVNGVQYARPESLVEGAKEKTPTLTDD